MCYIGSICHNYLFKKDVQPTIQNHATLRSLPRIGSFRPISTRLRWPIKFQASVDYFIKHPNQSSRPHNVNIYPHSFQNKLVLISLLRLQDLFPSWQQLWRYSEQLLLDVLVSSPIYATRQLHRLSKNCLTPALLYSGANLSTSHIIARGVEKEGTTIPQSAIEAATSTWTNGTALTYQEVRSKNISIICFTIFCFMFLYYVLQYYMFNVSVGM